MVKKEVISKICFSLVIVLLSLLIVPAILYKINKHNSDMWLVIDKRVMEAAEKCYIEGNCESNITLNDLIEKGYIEKIYNPLTKELIDGNSLIDIENNNFKRE